MSTELPPDVANPPNGDVAHNEGAKNNVDATLVQDGNEGTVVNETNQIATEVPHETAETTEDLDKPFSWVDPHCYFAIIMVGKEETPFGIHRNFLAAKSTYFKQYFKEHPNGSSLENIVHLPETTPAVFGFAQNFIYTGQVFPESHGLLSYDDLINLWKLGHQLEIEGLCDAALEAMTECRRATLSIPATPLLVQAWKETPENSSIRTLLLSWAAEYMRSSESRAEFARSLPQEVLSELVVAMTSLEPAPVILDTLPPPASASASSPPEATTAGPTTGQRRNASHLDTVEGDGTVSARPAKKQRNSDAIPNGSAPGPTNTKAAARKGSGSRVSLPAGKSKRKSNSGLSGGVDGQPFSANQRLNFCADLLTRMLSGPGRCFGIVSDLLLQIVILTKITGFWTRLVGPFKEPVNPKEDGVPDYLDKITKPMDLGTMKAKMDRHEYADEVEFLADMNQIFTNCYTYWSDQHPMWLACERLQKIFEEKYGQMNKWISKMEGDEGGH